MESKIQVIKDNLILVVSALVLMKLYSSGLTGADAAGAVAVISGLLAKTVIEYLFPRRPNLFAELKKIETAIASANDRLDALDRDCTALKFTVRGK